MSQDRTDVGALRWFLLLADTVTCLALFFAVSTAKASTVTRPNPFPANMDTRTVREAHPYM